MPSKTPKQARAMQAAAHGKSKAGIPQKVGKEFARADAKAAAPGKKPAPPPGPSKSAGPPITSSTMAPQDAVYKASPGSLASVFVKGVK